jgi:hypothetical protein
MLQLHAFSGGDRFDPLVQWFSLVGSVVGVTLLAQLLGAGSHGQVFAAVFCATIPQGILEASGVKNDYVVAFWLVVLAYYLFTFRREPTWPHTFGIGAVLGLAWLTKGTAYIFSLAMLLTWGLAWLWKPRRRILGSLLLAVVLATGLNAGHFIRNYKLFNSALGPKYYYGDPSRTLTNDKITSGLLASNVLRNLALHLGTPIETINRTLDTWIKAVIHTMGEDPNLKEIMGNETFRVPKMSRHESLAGNPIHLILIMLSFAMLIFGKQVRKSNGIVMSTSGLVLAFVLFCALLSWLPYHARLHLPLFVLWSAAIGTLLTQTWPYSVTNSLAILLLLLAVPVALQNSLRPLLFGGNINILTQERQALYFTEAREVPNIFVNLLNSSRAVSEFLKGEACQDIGLDSVADVREYPLLTMLEADRGIRRVRHVAINPLWLYAGNKNDLRPCVVICLQCSTAIEKKKWYTSWIGPETVFQDIVVFSSTARLPNHDRLAFQSPGCTLTFSSGWHGLEQSGQDWWRWTDRRGEIRVFAAQDSQMVVRGEMVSAQRPNKADILVNNKRATTVDFADDRSKSFETVGSHLKVGENTIAFSSHNPAIHIPPDNRALALAVKNLVITSADATTVCVLQP